MQESGGGHTCTSEASAASSTSAAPASLVSPVTPGISNSAGKVKEAVRRQKSEPPLSPRAISVKFHRLTDTRGSYRPNTPQDHPPPSGQPHLAGSIIMAGRAASPPPLVGVTLNINTPWSIMYMIYMYVWIQCLFPAERRGPRWLVVSTKNKSPAKFRDISIPGLRLIEYVLATSGRPVHPCHRGSFHLLDEEDF
jgi:hypothetical protein